MWIVLPDAQPGAPPGNRPAPVVIRRRQVPPWGHHGRWGYMGTEHVGLGGLGAAGPLYGAPGGETPRASLGRFRGTDDTIRMMLEYARGAEGEQNARVRQWAESIVRQVAPKDYLSEILALRHWCTGPQLRYSNDARHVEQVKTPFRTLLEVEKYKISLLDCDDYATLIATLGMCLGREARFTMVGFGAPGDYSHVFACLREPRSGEWIICDPVAGTRELVMAQTAKTFKHISVDK